MARYKRNDDADDADDDDDMCSTKPRVCIASTPRLYNESFIVEKRETLDRRYRVKVRLIVASLSLFLLDPKTGLHTLRTLLVVVLVVWVAVIRFAIC